MVGEKGGGVRCHLGKLERQGCKLPPFWCAYFLFISLEIPILDSVFCCGHLVYYPPGGPVPSGGAFCLFFTFFARVEKTEGLSLHMSADIMEANKREECGRRGFRVPSTSAVNGGVTGSGEKSAVERAMDDRGRSGEREGERSGAMVEQGPATARAGGDGRNETERAGETGRRGGERRQQDVKKYEKDLTVMAEILGEERLKTMEVMRAMRDICGGLIAFREIGINKYEVTVKSEYGKKRLLDGFKIGRAVVMVKSLAVDELVVSFLNLPAYITDEEILEKLDVWGVKAVSAIRRRVWPGTDIADGTRYVKVKFNDTVQSLPYSTKFLTATGPEYFRVVHNNQVKVCRMCLQPGHVVRDCPEFTCFKCDKQGHYARECDSLTHRCEACHNPAEECTCHNTAVIEKEGGQESISGEGLGGVQSVRETEHEMEVQDEAEEVECVLETQGSQILERGKNDVLIGSSMDREIGEMEAGMEGMESTGVGSEGDPSLSSLFPSPEIISQRKMTPSSGLDTASVLPGASRESLIESDLEMDFQQVKVVRKRTQLEQQTKSEGGKQRKGRKQTKK